MSCQIHLLNLRKKVIKSQVPVLNASVKVDVLEGKYQTANESKERLKRDRPSV